jgi:hypothetical protein
MKKQKGPKENPFDIHGRGKTEEQPPLEVTNEIVIDEEAPQASHQDWAGADRSYDHAQTPPEPAKPQESKPEKKNEQAEKQPTASLIPIGPDGKVMARDNSELMRYCGAMIQGGAIPKRFDTPQKLFAALMFVRDLKLPDTAIRQIGDVHGQMMAFGDLPLAMAQRSGEMIFLVEQWFDKDYKIISFENKNLKDDAWGAVCFMQRKGGEKQSFSFLLDEAKAAGTYPGKAGMPWNRHTRLMLRYKARSIALKSLFADKINGMGIGESDADAFLEHPERDVTQTPDDNLGFKSSGLNDKVNGGVS